MARHRVIKERRREWTERINKLNKEATLTKLKQTKQPLLHLKTTMVDTLPPSTEEVKTTKKVTQTTNISSQRGRKHALAKEQEQFKAVLNHQQFRENPLGILRKHLENTVIMAKKQNK